MHSSARAVTYYRVSTHEQGASGLGLEAQQDAVQSHAARACILAFTLLDGIGEVRRHPKVQWAWIRYLQQRVTCPTIKHPT